MKLLECKDKLTINELLQIAFEYGNDNADMPADSESITESFNEWIKSNDDLFKKLILPHVSNNEALELSDGVAFANYIEEKWKQYRTITNNEDAWCFKQWLVGK